MGLPSGVRSLENIFRLHSAEKVAGVYTAKGTNSTMILELDDGSGLKITKFWSNGLDMSTVITGLMLGGNPGLEMRTTPTGVKTCDGERFRIKVTSTELPKNTFMGGEQFCLGDLGGPTYGGEALLEIVKKANSLYLPGFRVELFKQ